MGPADTSPFQSALAAHKQDRTLLNSSIIRNAMVTAAFSFLGLSVEVRLMMANLRSLIYDTTTTGEADHTEQT